MQGLAKLKSLRLLFSILAVSACYLALFQIPLSFYPSLSSGLYAQFILSILLGLSVGSAILSAVNIAFTGFLWLKPLPAELKARPLTESLPLRLIASNPKLTDWVKRLSADLGRDALMAGETISPYRFMAKNLFYTFIGFLVTTPLAIALTFLVSSIFLPLAVIPALFAFYPKLTLKSRVSERRKELEDEVPFFAIYGSILQSVGVTLYESMLALIGKKIFKQVEKDALIVKRAVEFFFKSPLEALEELGRWHPNEKLRIMLLGYTSEWRSGGNVAGYLETKADDYLADMKFRWRKYAEAATAYGEILVSMFFLLPMMILMVAFLMPGQATSMLSQVLVFVVPFLTLAIYMGVAASQPKTYDVVTGDLKLPIVVGVMVGALTVLMGQPAWMILAALMAAASAVYGALTFLQLREISLTEKGLVQFLRDITEYKKMGYDIARALVRIAKENVYNPVFDNLLKMVARQVELGRRMVEVEVPVRSWLTKISFFILGQVVESGGGTARCLEMLTNFINEVTRAKKEAKSYMKIYDMLATVTPVMLSFVIALMFSLLQGFQGILMPATLVEAGVIGETGLKELLTVPQEMVEMSYLFVVVCSMAIAFLAGKTVDLTGKSTLRVAVNLSLAAAGIALSGSIVQPLLQAMFAGIGGFPAPSG